MDPRLSETARMAGIHIMPRAGTDSLMLRAMIALILKNGWENKAYLEKYARDLDKVRPWFEGFDIEGAFRVCNVGQKQMEDFCRLLTTKKWGGHPGLWTADSRNRPLRCRRSFASSRHKQIILHRGLPFSLTLPDDRPVAVGGMSHAQIDAELNKGMESLQNGRRCSADEVDNELAQEFGI